MRPFLVLLSLSAYCLSSCNASKRIRIECPNIETNLSSLKSSGSLILDGDGTYLRNMDSLATTKLNKPDEGLYYFAFSPKRDWISYVSSLTDDLLIANVESEVIKAILWEDDWAYANWLNEEQLIISLIQKDQTSNSSNFLVLNPFTNERNLLIAEFPQIYYMQPWRIIEYSAQID
ncbi:MAG TPA: hypothetical protein VFQ23_03940, partial [Anaerolineales bacterium]|nr:hypothetical protein [Anaerolineales bacterium]